MTDEDGAPSMSQLGDPVLVTPNVRVFDFLRQETVEISRIDGGNPALGGDNRRVYKLGLTLKPFGKTDLTLTANYNRSRILNPIAGFPTATAEIEAAFPDRFVRDAAGRLLRIDNRPVNFARSDRSELRWGINFAKPIGPQPPPGGFRGPSRRRRWSGRRRPGRGGGQAGGRPGGGRPGRRRSAWAGRAAVLAAVSAAVDGAASAAGAAASADAAAESSSRSTTLVHFTDTILIRAGRA